MMIENTRIKSKKKILFWFNSHPPQAASYFLPQFCDYRNLHFHIVLLYHFQGASVHLYKSQKNTARPIKESQLAMLYAHAPWYHTVNT